MEETTTDVANILLRNTRKRENLDCLSSLSEIHIKAKRPKYSVFFFSNNLDHFLYGDANLSAREKINKSDEYAARYELDPDGFVSAINSTPGALLDMSYEQSWQFIKENNITNDFEKIKELCY